MGAEPGYTITKQGLMSNYDLIYVAPEDIDRIWFGVEDYLQRALDRNDGEYLVSDYYNLIAEGKNQLWIMYGGDIKAAIVTEVYQTPQKRIFDIILLGGDNMSEWIEPLEEQMTKEAISQKCDLIKITGRRGWAKMNGFEEKHTIMVRRL